MSRGQLDLPDTASRNHAESQFRLNACIAEYPSSGFSPARTDTSDETFYRELFYFGADHYDACTETSVTSTPTKAQAAFMPRSDWHYLSSVQLQLDLTDYLDQMCFTARCPAAPNAWQRPGRAASGFLGKPVLSPIAIATSKDHADEW